MTIEEAINELKHAYAFCKTEPSFQEAINTVIHNHVEYAWHDLRKNPRDLPRQYVWVEVKFETGNYNHGIYDYYDECFAYKNVSKKDLRSKVILWRYIEQSEEE